MNNLSVMGLDADELAAFDSLSESEQREYISLLEQVLDAYWTLTPKQRLAEVLWHKVDWMLYGGSAAGGKSEFACWHANRLSEKVDGHVSLLLRQSIPELRRSLILRMIARVKQFKIPARLRKVDGQTGFHYGNGSLIECGYLATDEHVGNYLCFHPSHDILTQEGWKPVADVKQWDLVATVDPKTNLMWYEPVTKVHEYDYDGEMIEVDQNHGLSMCVTPNHTVWCRTKDKPEPRPFRADSMPASARIPRTARAGRQRMPHDFTFASDGNNGRSITIDAKTFAEFLGWFASEGSTDPARWAVRIHQHKAEGQAQIENLLNRMGVNWHFSAGAYSFNNKALVEYLREHVGTHSGTKRLPCHLVQYFPAELLDLFLAAYTAGDGTSYRDDSFRIIVTSSPIMAEDLSHVAFKAGWRVTSHSTEKVAFNGYKGEGLMYQLYLSKAKPGEGQVRPDAVKRVQYKGKVHCVTVPPYNTLVTRRNGRIHWTGNSAEYDLIIVDEATQLTSDQIVQIAGRLRTTKEKAARGARPHLGLFTNPGSRSHAWMYDTFVFPTNYGNKVVVYNVANGMENAVVAREYTAPISLADATLEQIEDILIPWAEKLVIECDPQVELSVAFVPAKATDNPHIDPSYLKMLNALPEKRRRQMRDGDWDTYEGQYFHEWRRDIHVVEPFDIPEAWPKARGADFGTRAPWCCLWGAWDNDGNCYIYREAYAKGMTPEMQAKQAAELSWWENEQGVRQKERYERTVADPSVFGDKRGAGRTVAQMWADNGFRVSPAKRASRVSGWANVRQYLWDVETNQPRMYVFSTCTNLIRTIPIQMHAKVDQEDLDTTLDDHAVDALRYLLSTRPIGRREAPKKHGQTLDERFTSMLKKIDKTKRGRAWT